MIRLNLAGFRRLLGAVRFALAGLAFIAGGQATPALALGILIPRVPEVSPIEPGRTEVRVEIRNNVARTRVHQEFFNPNARPLEADFFFPVPQGASVTDFTLYVDGKPQHGEIVEKDKARGIYEDIVRRLRDPGLLEWADFNIFRVAVFPVPARGTQTVEIEFGQPLAADQGVFRYVFPMAGPAIAANRQRAVEPAQRGQPGAADVRFEITLTGDRELGNIYSPTHRIDVRRDTPTQWKIQVLPENVSDWRKNFILLYDYREKGVAATLLAARKPPDAGFFCLMLSPDTKQLTTSTPLDLIFVLDTSGSMSEDDKIDQARRAVRYCLSQLGENDRFAIVRFSTEVEKYTEGLTSATAAELARAREWVGGLRAAGGTNIAEALETALELAGHEGGATSSPARRHMIIFVTDGVPTVGETSADRILDLVSKRIEKQDVRVFTFGVGHDVNTRLLDQLAERSRGWAEYVAPKEDLEVPVARLFDKVARPALSSPEISIEGTEVFDVYPKKLPDLFYGTQATVLGRYKKGGPARIRLRDEMGGKPTEFVFEKLFPEEARETDYVERLWATRKIGYLLDELRQRPDAKEIKDEVIALSKRYGIVTPLTSYLVVEDKPELLQRGGIRNPAGAAADRNSNVGGPRRTLGGPSAMPMAASAAVKGLRAESGEAAVAAAQAVRALKDATAAPGPASASLPVQWVEGRAFARQGDIWMEEGTESVSELVRVKAYSDAYFALIKLQPKVRAILQLGDRIRFKIGDMVIEIGNEGVEKLPAEIESRLRT
jgi:Ca-activated chloride channel family protein